MSTHPLENCRRQNSDSARGRLLAWLGSAGAFHNSTMEQVSAINSGLPAFTFHSSPLL